MAAYSIMPVCLPASNSIQISLPVWLKFGIVDIYILRFWFGLIHFNPAVPSVLIMSNLCIVCWKLRYAVDQ
jgi:hypothetical protein